MSTVPSAIRTCLVDREISGPTSNNSKVQPSLEIEERGTSSGLFPYFPSEDAMRAYINNLPTRTWLLLVIPFVMLAYPVVRIAIPVVLHAVVPDVVRSVLSVI
jgi:hypothetical protein